MVSDEQRDPVLLDLLTGGQVSVLPLSLCQKLKPPVNLPVPTREVATYGNNTVKFHGPVPLHVQLCGITILHPFYIVDDSKAGLFSIICEFLPARLYGSAGNMDRNVSVCPSVVTSRYCVKKRKASVMISSPSGSPMFLVFIQISSRHSKGSPERAGPQTREEW